MTDRTCSNCVEYEYNNSSLCMVTDKTDNCRCPNWHSGDSEPDNIEHITPHVAGSCPVLPHPTWNICDASKMEEYMRCPRKFFFRYVLGWDSEYRSHDLDFGTAWHIAMEHLLLNGYTRDQIIEAHRLFCNFYEYYWPIESQTELEPKSSSGALLGLTYYTAEYSTDHFEVLYTEVAGSITVLNNRVMHFRMDSINRDDRGIFSLEHKTARSLERQWQDQWSLHNQPNLYSHVLYCLFPNEPVYGVILNGTALYKQGPRTKNPPAKFLRVPCKRTPEMMEAWLINLDNWLNDLERDYNRLSSCSDSDVVLNAFRQNPTSCTDFWGCRYRDFCIGWANPLQHCQDVPSGFVERWWNPAKPDEDRPAPKYQIQDGIITKGGE